MTNCIFCKIISGDIPSFTVYEDEDFKVIMDRFPASPGHVLVLTKMHHENILDMPEEISQKLYPLVKKIAQAITKALGVPGVNVLQNNGEIAGQAVFHSHVHIIPRRSEDGVVLNKTSRQDTTLEELENIAKQIKKALV